MIRRPARRLGVATAAVCVGVLMLTGISTPAIAADPVNTGCTSMSLAQAQSRILADVNAARAANGRSALTENPSMDAVATAWSARQASAASMSHNPDYATQIPSGWSSAAENVAYGQSVAGVTTAWMNSSGHRANILNAAFTHIGIGVACSAKGAPYYTQVFGSYSRDPGASVAPIPAAGFAVQAHVQNMGWINGGGTTGRGLRLEALRITQTQSTQTVCLRAHVANIGWMTAQCTTGTGTTITAGTTGRGLRLEALEIWTPGARVWARGHVQNIGWQPVQTATTAGGRITIGTTGRSLAMEQAQLWP